MVFLCGDAPGFLLVADGVATPLLGDRQHDLRAAFGSRNQLDLPAQQFDGLARCEQADAQLFPWRVMDSSSCVNGSNAR